jgi:ribonucleoside-diphosphate reductase alpha chain
MTRSKDLILKRLRDEVGLTKSDSKRIAKKLDALSQSVSWATPPTQRKKLPSDRDAITHKFSIGGHEGFLTVGKYRDGAPGELLIRLDKEGSTLSGVLDGLSITFSLALQYGVPLRAIVDKFVHMKFEPSGYTGNPRIRYAKSLLDYVGRYLGGIFISPDYFDAPTSDESPSAKRNPVRTTRTGKSDLKTSRLHKTAKRD